MTGSRRLLVSCWLGVLGLLLVGCAAQMPAALRTPPTAALTVGAAREAPEQHAGTRVRWGGAILAVRNATQTTDIEVLAQPLDAAGRPRPQAPAAAPDYGRFIARFAGFLDPAQYPEGRLITVTGTLSGVETRDVGAYPYRYPVVRAVGKHLWPRSEPEPDWLWPPGPWAWDPWNDWSYGPWYRPGLPAAPWYRPWYW
jgi:outer membrane lipoprotein